MAGIRANLAGIWNFRDYLAQHWQGGFTLGYAVWVNAVLLGLLIDLPLIALDELVEVLGGAGYRFAAAGLLVLALAIDLVVTTWLLVGVARSAALHEERGGRPVWARLTRCFLIVVLIGLPFLLLDEFRTLRELLLTSGRLATSIG